LPLVSSRSLVLTTAAPDGLGLDGLGATRARLTACGGFTGCLLAPVTTFERAPD
jgi:hypothetical protein